MRDRIDELLDSALSTYIESPRPGLERRIMHRIRTRRRAWHILLPALAAATLACVSFFLPRADIVPTIEFRAAIQTPPPVSAQHVAAPIQRPKLVPRQSTFPMATPLTGAERALLAFAQSHPETATAVADNLKKANSDLPEIQPLEIPLLKSETGQ
jgi:hypothetical protein